MASIWMGFGMVFGMVFEYTWEKQYWVSLYVAACLVHLCNGGHHSNAPIVLAKKRLPSVDMLDR